MPSTWVWKLAQVVSRSSPEGLLDTYHAERHPVGARVLQNTMAQVALSRIDERSQALRNTILELLKMDEPRRRIAGMISGLDIHYDLGEGHPLLGRRMPDLDLETAEGPRHVFALLHDAPGGCSSTSARPAVSTSSLGRVESSSLRPSTTVYANSRSSARLRLLRLC